MKLKYKYKVRLIVEESFSFGVLGAGGRGLIEHFKVDVSLGVLGACMHGSGCEMTVTPSHHRDWWLFSALSLLT